MRHIPGNLPLSAYHAIATRTVRQIGASHRTCLLGGDRCPPAINSHSVAIAALNRIALRGHVYTFSSPAHDQLESIYNGGAYRPSPCGINQASTYRGFCGDHDNQIFSEVENRHIEPTARQVFLLHFRAYSRAFYLNINGDVALRAIASAKRPDGHNPEEVLSLLASYVQRQAEAFRDLEKNYASLVSLIGSKSQGRLNYTFLRLGCVPDVMCCTLFVPIFDIDGRFLLPLANQSELESCQTMSITISADSLGGFFLLAWTDRETITNAFVQTFIDSGYDLNRLLAVIFGHCENFFFKEEWWEKLDDDRRMLLMYFASVAFLNSGDRSRDHLQQMYGVLRGRQMAYIEWPVVSILHGDAARGDASSRP